MIEFERTKLRSNVHMHAHETRTLGLQCCNDDPDQAFDERSRLLLYRSGL